MATVCEECREHVHPGDRRVLSSQLGLSLSWLVRGKRMLLQDEAERERGKEGRRWREEEIICPLAKHLRKILNLPIVHSEIWLAEWMSACLDTGLRHSFSFFPLRLWYTGCETRPLKHPAESRLPARVGCRLTDHQPLALRLNLGQLTGTEQALEV